MLPVNSFDDYSARNLFYNKNYLHEIANLFLAILHLKNIHRYNKNNINLITSNIIHIMIKLFQSKNCTCTV